MSQHKLDRRRFLEVAAIGGAAAAAALTSACRPQNRPKAYMNTKLPTPVCETCGTQYPPSHALPSQCPICEDDRQYVGLDGQKWTTPKQIAAEHRNEWTEHERGLRSVHTAPKFGIGQRAFLIETDEGNILWDCVTLLDDETIAYIEERGGLAAIAISHPHYFSAMVDYSQAFGDVPIYLHTKLRKWVMRPHANIRYWSGKSLPLVGGVTLRHTGGHFEGFQVLHWPRGANGRGVLMAGDQPQVAMDREWVSFMWSYPNYVPLSARQLRRVIGALEPLEYDRLYGAFSHQLIAGDAKQTVSRSAARYLEAISEA